jgi:hypothetical protein
MKLNLVRHGWLAMGVGTAAMAVLPLVISRPGKIPVAHSEVVATQGKVVPQPLRQKHRAIILDHVALSPEAELDLSWTNAISKAELERQVLLARRWTETDPRSAAAWVETLGTGGDRTPFLDAIAISWANRSASQAVDWARNLPDETEKGRALLAIAGEVGRDHPNEAMEIANEAAESPAKYESLGRLISESVHQSPIGAESLLKSLENHPEKESLSALGLVAWADVDPVSAGKFAVENLSPGKALDDAALAIVQRWAQKEPGDAESWARQFPDGDLKDTAIAEAVRLWTLADPVAAGQFLGSLPAGHERDVATRGLLQSISTAETGRARDWISRIDSETIREQETVRLNELQPSASSASEGPPLKVE